MGLRELKETAHAQYIRGKFEQCAQTYQQILRLAPKDPNMHVRHAEACRRAGDRQTAIASYRAAAELLLAVGCESRARGALKAALELDPRDAEVLGDLARMGHAGPSTPLEDERLSSLPPPGAMESWESPPPAAPLPPRSKTVAGVAAPVPPRSMTSACVAALSRALASAAAPARSMTSAGVAAPARSMTSAGVPAPMPPRSMTSAGVPAPVPPRSMTSAGVPAPEPRRSMTSAGVPAPVPPRSMTSADVPAPEPRRSMTSAGVPAPVPSRAASAPARPLALPSTPPPPPPECLSGPSLHGMKTPLPASAKDPAWASRGGLASTQASSTTPPPPPPECLAQDAAPPTPVPRATAPASPASSAVTPPPAPAAEPLVRLQMEVRRLGPHAIAFRLTPRSRWVLITSRAPIQVRRVDSLESLPEEPRDFTLDITVEEPDSDPLH
jgi:hypothetical protein